ncbi:unnamed protein product [Polarella glacialis]|uniref:MROH2B-like HEAT-repeats domain-containing protein n=1 Tax=Polarella glacialis TaxID=89957 RepID=A0A813IN24_POLGL|nr:unnamed protein product [Polarella glacialis]
MLISTLQHLLQDQLCSRHPLFGLSPPKYNTTQGSVSVVVVAVVIVVVVAVVVDGMDFPSPNIGGRLGKADGGRRVMAQAALGDDADLESDNSKEGECVQDIVYCLLETKGGASSTQQTQVAINSSIIQLAKSNFPLVVSAIFSFLEGQKITDQHDMQLLRLLCLVLETRRSDGDGSLDCNIDWTLAKNMARHLVQEVSKVGQAEARKRAISDVLVELAPMYPDLVLSDVLLAISSSSVPSISNSGSGNPPATQPVPPVLVHILTEVAYSTPHILEGRIHEVMSRYLDLMKRDRTPEMRLLLLRAWCSLCVALVNSAMTEPGDTMASDDSAFSRRFGAAAVALRRRRAAQSSELSSEDQRRAAQVLGTAFTLLMSLWQGWKDLTARVAVMEAFGHFSLVIPRDQFLTNADSLLELLLGLLSRQATALGSVAPLPPMALVRGTCLLLQACIDADPEMLTLENTLQTLTSSLFAWTVAGGPLQYLQGSLANEALQSQAELLRCFDVLAETFSRESLGFLLQKAKGGRDERLAALLVLRHLVGGDIGGAGASTTSRSNGGGASPRFTGSSPGVNWLSGQVVVAIVEGLQALLADGDPAVGLMLGELIVGMVGADMLSPRAASVAGEAKPTAVPKPEHVTALLSFLIRQTAKGPATDVAEQGYVAKLVTKGYAHSADGPSCEEVRSRAGLVLGQLAGSLKPPMRPVLWPMLLRALVNPAMLPGLPVLCRAATQILQSVKSSSEGDAAYRDAGLAQAMHASSGGPQPETLFLWLLVCAHNPLEPPGLGLSVLRCLESLSSLIHPMLGEIWEAPSKRLHTLCAYLEDGVPGDQEFWASALSQEVHFFLSALPEHDDLPARLVDILGGLLKEVSRKDSREASTLAAGAGLGTSDPSDLHRAAIFNLSGVCLSHLGQASKASAAMDALFAYASGTSGSAGTSDQLLGTPAVRRAFARGIGLAAKRHFDLALSALARAARTLGRRAKTDAATRRTGSLAQSFFGKSNAVHIAEQSETQHALPSTRLLCIPGSFEQVFKPSCFRVMASGAEAVMAGRARSFTSSTSGEGVRTHPEAVAPGASESSKGRCFVIGRQRSTHKPPSSNLLGGTSSNQPRVEAVRLACNALGATPDALVATFKLPAARTIYEVERVQYGLDTMAYEGGACEGDSDGTESMSASPVAVSPGSPCDPFQLDSGDENLASLAADEVQFTTPVRQTEQQYFSPANRVLDFDTCSEAPAAAPTLVQQLDGDLQLPSNSGMLAQCQAVSMERVRRFFADLSSLKPGLPPPLFHRGPSAHFQRSGPGVPTTSALAVQTLARPRISLNEPRFLNLEVPQPQGLPAPCFVGRQLGISAIPAGAAQALPALAPLGAGRKTPKPRYFARQPPQQGFSIPATSTLEPAVAQENDVKNVLILVWVSIILPLAMHSPLFSSMGGDFTKHLRVLLGGSSTGTLRRHMPGWKLWLEFSANANCKDLPSLPDVLDFLEALLSGQVMDRGSGKSNVFWLQSPTF